MFSLQKHIQVHLCKQLLLQLCQSSPLLLVLHHGLKAVDHQAGVKAGLAQDRMAELHHGHDPTHKSQQAQAEQQGLLLVQEVQVLVGWMQ